MRGRAYLSLGGSPKVDLTELHCLLQCSLLVHLYRREAYNQGIQATEPDLLPACPLMYC